MMNKFYSSEGDFFNFKSRFQIYRRILFCTSNLSHKYFTKKDHKKYLEKMNFLFERTFFYLREWFKYLQYYIVESGNPEHKIVKELKENLLPLSKNERYALFYQKPDEEKEDLSPKKRDEKMVFKLNCIIFLILSKYL